MDNQESKINTTDIANASITAAYNVLSKLRSIDNSMKGVTESCIGKADITEDEWRLAKDIYLRLRKLNSGVTVTSQEITTSMAIEVWHAFFTSNDDVSFATAGIRDDLLKRNTPTMKMGDLKCIDHFLKSEGSTASFSFTEFTDWVTAFCGGDTAIEINYYSKFHHCRWLEGVCEPKLNCFNVCTSLGKTSLMLRSIHRTCPTGVSQIGHYGQTNTFNVDRTLDDMLIIVEEAPNFLLNKRGKNGHNNESDASNMMKCRLTTGVMTVAHFFVDEEENNRRDMKYIKTSVQGNYLMATSNDILSFDKHVISRFLVVHGNESGKDLKFSDLQLAQHRDLHRVYYIVECMVKSKVIEVNTEGAWLSLNEMQFASSRKRNNTLEMARILCIASVVWRVMMSPQFAHLQYHPANGQYIGLNVRVIVEGIFPLLIVTQQMVTHALYLLKSQEHM